MNVHHARSSKTIRISQYPLSIACSRSGTYCHHQVLIDFCVDLEPWLSTSIQEGSSSRSARIARSFMNLEHMSTCSKARDSSSWDIRVMVLPKSRMCLFVGVRNQITAIVNSLRWGEQCELPKKHFAIGWALLATTISLFDSGSQLVTEQSWIKGGKRTRSRERTQFRTRQLGEGRNKAEWAVCK